MIIASITAQIIQQSTSLKTENNSKEDLAKVIYVWLELLPNTVKFPEVKFMFEAFKFKKVWFNS